MCPFRLTKIVERPGPRVGTQEVDVLRFLQLAFEAFGHLRQRIVESSAGPRGPHNHRAEREGRILVSSEPVIGHQARDDDREHREHDERSVFQRPVGKIGPIMASSPADEPSGRMQRLDAAVTTISPPSSPLDDDRARIEPLHLDRPEPP